MANSGSSYNGNEAYFRQLTRTLDSASQEAIPQDDFVNALHSYRETSHKATSPSPQTRDDIWQSINIQISQNSDVPSSEEARIYQLSGIWKRWALAASLLLVALGGLYLAQKFAGENTIAVAHQQMKTVTLADGSTITLRPNSELYRVSDTDQRQTLKLNGEAWFEIEGNRNRTLIVEAGNGRIEVTGTRFMVSEWNQQVQVYLESGSIKFERLKNEDPIESVTLQPGQYSKITKQKQLLPPSIEPIDAYNDWLEHQMVFDSRTLEYLFAELEQHYAINIEAPAKVLDDTLSGRILLEDVAGSLQELERVLPGKFEKTGTAKYRYIPG